MIDGRDGRLPAAPAGGSRRELDAPPEPDAAPPGEPDAAPPGEPDAAPPGEPDVAGDRRQEVERLRKSRERQARDAREAVEELESVLTSRERPLGGETPLMRALTALGREIGVTVRPPGKSEEVGRSDPVEAIGRASGFRTRRVRLTGRWWTRDCGALLALAGEERRPVALLRGPSQRYAIFDPADGSRTRVDARSAARLDSRAVMLYRPLPPGRLSLLDLARFALKPRRRELFIALAASVAATLLGMVTPQATALLIDHAIPDANRRLLFEIGAVLVAAAFGATLFRLSQGIVLLRIGLGSEAEGQAAVWDRLLRLRPSFFRGFSSGDLQSRVMAVNEIGRRLSGAMLSTLFISVTALLNFFLLYYYSPRLTLLAVAFALVAMVVTLATGVVVRRHLREVMEVEGRLFGLVIQLIDGVAKLRVAGAGQRAFSHWLRRYTRQLELDANVVRLRDGLSVFNQVLPSLSLPVLFVAAFQVLVAAQEPGSGAVSLGTFLAFTVAFSIFLSGVTSLSGTLVDFLDLSAVGRRIRPILDEPPEVDESKADPGTLAGGLSLRKVDFRYAEDGPPVLDKVDLEAAPGELVAIVGPSGSGKSTILRLMLGFERPRAGTVAYDGRDLAALDVLAVRRQLGVVLQDGTVEGGSIFGNIASGHRIGLEQAWQAAEAAGLADEIREMPMGMHTLVSVGGGNLSGGQRQRLLIARALAHHPRILLLDEATSSLDNRTQALVAASLARLSVTRIVVAHRLSTIREADRIYVVDAGRVVQVGSYTELMQDADGLFARMMRRQLA